MPRTERVEPAIRLRKNGRPTRSATRLRTLSTRTRLGVAVEALLEDDAKAAAKRGPVPKLQQQMDRIAQLPKARQQFVMQVIDSVIAQSAS